MTRKSEITRAPSPIAQARSATTRPRSWTRIRGVASARDNPPVSPVLSARYRSSVSPACDTTPAPPPVTSSPRDHPVTFTSKVLLDLGLIRTSTPLIVPVQEHFSVLARPPGHIPL